MAPCERAHNAEPATVMVAGSAISATRRHRNRARLCYNRPTVRLERLARWRPPMRLVARPVRPAIHPVSPDL